MSDETCLQESPEKKAEWLALTEVSFPIGAYVLVVDSDLDEYIGKTGVVADYDLGCSGSWPTVGVVFDSPVTVDGKVMVRDGFYPDDEIVLRPMSDNGGSR